MMGPTQTLRGWTVNARSRTEEEATEALAAFARDLQSLRLKCGAPTVRSMARANKNCAGMSVSNLSEVLGGKRLPTIDVTIRIIQTLVDCASRNAGLTLESAQELVDYWRKRWTHAKALHMQADKLQRQSRSTQASGKNELASLLPGRPPHSTLALEERAAAVQVGASHPTGTVDHIAAASMVRTFGGRYIPEVLQCPGYSRSIVESMVHCNREDFHDEIARRDERRCLLDQQNAPVYWVVVDEAALRRPIGGVETMWAQLEYLIDMALKPNFCIQLLPFAAQVYAGGCDFSLLRFTNPQLGDMVALEQTTGREFLDNTDQVEKYTQLIDRACLGALTPADSMRVLKHYAMIGRR